MSLSLAYGDGAFEVRLPKEKIGFVIEPNPVEAPRLSAAELIRASLDSPIGTRPVEELVHPGEKVCVVISDGTRSWQKPDLILKELFARLNAAGIADRDIFILSARGTHRKQSAEELRKLVSPEIYDRAAFVRDHDPLDADNLTMLGTTSYGTPVSINSLAVQADRVILIGAVLHHFLAGFSGGRKSVLPGIAGYQTVQANHALSLAPEGGFRASVRSGNTEGNPVHQDMCEAAKLLNPDFIINTVVDESYRILKVFSGDLIQAHTEACKMVDRMNAVTIPHRYDVVIASAGGYPKDINVYQPLKTLCHMIECVKPGGTMIMLSESREGFGSPDAEAQMKDYDTMPQRETALRAHYTIGGATGYLYADAAEKYRFIYVTKLPAAEFSHTKMQIVPDLDSALALVGEIADGSVVLMPNGSVTLPRPGREKL